MCGLQRGKKRHWKEAYHTSSDEVTALHTQLLAKHKDLEALEGHLNQLHTELVMLDINTGASVKGKRVLGPRGFGVTVLHTKLVAKQ